MPFKLFDKPTYWFKATVRQVDEHGGFSAFEFRAEFKRRSQDEIDAMMRAPRSDRELLDSEWVGWKDVKSSAGGDLEVNEVNRTALLAEPGVEKALVRAWLEASVTGHLKN